jgi:hypothetical protein
LRKNKMPESFGKLVIISGGSEVISLALAKAALTASISYSVCSLVPNSILKNIPGCVDFVELHPFINDWSSLRNEFLCALKKFSKNADVLTMLPTEDGSLRLLNECREDVLVFGEFPRARNLIMGGIDKAEVIEFSAIAGIEHVLAPGKVIYNFNEASSVFDEYGADAIFKPALKPLDMDLSIMGPEGVKLITQTDSHDSASAIVRRLQKSWHLSERWIAQPRLQVGSNLERSVCAVRGNVIHACQVIERAKYPPIGGTAYWVSTQKETDLVEKASILMKALDVVGICELSYLPDNQGAGHLIELNPRPWLQVGLLERAGFNILRETICVLQNQLISDGQPVIDEYDWIQPERMLQSFLKGEISMKNAIRILPVLFEKTTTLGGYDNFTPGIRKKMLKRSLKKFSNIFS